MTIQPQGGLPAVKVINLINFKISMGHPTGLLYCPMGQSTALLDNSRDYFNPLAYARKVLLTGSYTLDS